MKESATSKRWQKTAGVDARTMCNATRCKCTIKSILSKSRFPFSLRSWAAARLRRCYLITAKDYIIRKMNRLAYQRVLKKAHGFYKPSGKPLDEEGVGSQSLYKTLEQHFSTFFMCIQEFQRLNNWKGLSCLNT